MLCIVKLHGIMFWRCLGARSPRFRCQFVCSQVKEGSNWNGRTGRISPEHLTQLVPDWKSRNVYLCGPVGFMDAARAMLEQLGYEHDVVPSGDL